MEELKNDKRLNWLKTVFIFVSLFFILYSTITMRGIYIEGTHEMLMRLNAFDSNCSLWNIFLAKSPIMSLLHLPVVFSHYIFRVDNKIALMMIFSCSLLLLPFLLLCWNYCLTKRTQRIDIFFWGLFVYSLILLTFSIFSTSEILLGSLLSILLWHYMAMNADYKIKDIVLILLLTFCLFGKYDFIVLMGPIFLIASLMYAKREDNIKNKILKLFIGISVYSISVFNFAYILYAPNKLNHLMSFIEEGYNYFPHMLHICIIMSVLALGFLLYSLFCRKKFSNITLSIIGIIFLVSFGIFVNNLNLTLVPMWEGHLRTIPCWALPLIFIGIFVFDLQKRKINIDKFYNYFCIVLICGILQTCWQLINTYFWDLNVQYMKKELYANQEALYIPSQHDEISSFFNPSLRRYIWHSHYAGTSILFSDSYIIKTLLLNYDETVEDGNYSFSNKLFILPNGVEISVPPFGTNINIKNKYWDLTNIRNALDKYNIKNNIQTDKT